MRCIIGLIILNIVLLVTHWIFEFIFRLFPFCCFNFRKKLQKAEVDDEEVEPEAEVLSSEESVEPKVVVQPPVEIVIPAAGVLVEKGHEYQFQKDEVIDNKQKMPKEEFKEIRPANVEDDEDYIINKKNTPGGGDNFAAGNTFLGATGSGTPGGKGLFER
eukprot:CAMPEP_0205823370 /NCGR_PEP_ID=MMETSP0206-20130828/16226_1 /ASSEMBLY_ACC=CAM_ASM_000279 /TAXON_ID=36767 /ORGANISM="Euplotes focardii, Strain TN1" /LENGTH=159 /DNA_ID=CAMNT_0053120473 /DNA_START=2310 /DNA_END=2789 /DNA_ORIENTATION=-